MRVVVLSAYDFQEDIIRSFQAGAQAFLLKDTTREKLIAAIRAVYQGQTGLVNLIA
jgi:DNA-binding NarL/FixJ family response regulator